MTDAPLTRRQRDALVWLQRVGKASERLVRRHGFMPRTLDALAEAGLIERYYLATDTFSPRKVYRAKGSS